VPDSSCLNEETNEENDNNELNLNDNDQESRHATNINKKPSLVNKNLLKLLNLILEKDKNERLESKISN
jgi:hypothetical protein